MFSLHSGTTEHGLRMSFIMSPSRVLGKTADRFRARHRPNRDGSGNHRGIPAVRAGRGWVTTLLITALVVSAGQCAWSESGPGNDHPPALPRLPGAQPAGYRLAPGDQIRIEVFAEPDLATSARITAHGLISMPLIGDVEVVNRPVEEIAAEIQRRLEDGYVRNAPATVTVVEYSVRLAYVMGSVEHQCAITLDPFSPTTAMQAIGKAGGFLPDANHRATQVVRDDPTLPTKKLRLTVMPLAVPDLDSKDIILQPGDMVVVPQLDRIIVTGRVKNAGALNQTGIDHLTLSKAISLAGGFDTYAKQTQVQLIRDGEAIRVIDVQALLNGQRGDDPVLMPGDTVVVPESHF
jgi:protein involved in polysaccharide export with SLBB domain